MKLSQNLQALIDAEAGKPNTHGIILQVFSSNCQIDFKGSAGAAAPDTSFPIASITKMYTAALVIQLFDEGHIKLDQTVSSILTDVDLSGLHVVKGVDHGPALTVRQLLHQTSGLADYYESDLAHDLKQGKDRSYDLKDVLQMTKALPPSAAPDSGRSYYSDTNYQLLGAVIEAVTGLTYDQALQARICKPLGLTQTGVLQGTDIGMPVYHKDQRLDVPLILASMTSDGGVISTLDELLVFLRAFMDGRLFKPENAAQMRQWNRLFFPLQYGYGLMRIKLPLWMTLFRATPELIGHSGASGSFAYYAPDRDTYILGSFNQTDAPRRPIGSMLKALAIVANMGARNEAGAQMDSGDLLGAFLSLFLGTRGDYPVASLVIDDPTLPSETIAGVHLHMRVHEVPADAPVIIVLHGRPGGDFRSLEALASLSDEFTVVFYDQRGAGLSERVPSEMLTLDGYLAELAAIIEAVSPDAPPILIGHSLGGNARDRLSWPEP